MDRIRSGIEKAIKIIDGKPYLKMLTKDGWVYVPLDIKKPTVK